MKTQKVYFAVLTDEIIEEGIPVEFNEKGEIEKIPWVNEVVWLNLDIPKQVNGKNFKISSSFND